MSLWERASRAYESAEVERLCLELQDDYGQCVSYLLWAVWAARHGRPVGEAQLAVAAGLARDWETEVGWPLRAVRRTLKRPWPPMADGRREALRSKVKASELSAERTLLEALEALTPRHATPGDATVAQRLHAAMAAWSTPPPIAAAEGLLPIFERFAI